MTTRGPADLMVPGMPGSDVLLDGVGAVVDPEAAGRLGPEDVGDGLIEGSTEAVGGVACPAWSWSLPLHPAIASARTTSSPACRTPIAVSITPASTTLSVLWPHRYGGSAHRLGEVSMAESQRPRAARPTMNDVAHAAGVGLKTVSRGGNGEAGVLAGSAGGGGEGS